MHRRPMLFAYWGQLSHQVTLRRTFLHKHIPSFGHHVSGAIVLEDSRSDLSQKEQQRVTARTAVSSPSDDLVLADMPAHCSQALADRAVKACEQCRLAHWKGFTLFEKIVRLLSLCAYLRSTETLRTLSRIEALQTGIPLPFIEKSLREQLDGVYKALIKELLRFKGESKRIARFAPKMENFAKNLENVQSFTFPPPSCKGVVHILYGSSTYPFTVAPVHWCIADIFGALFHSHTVVLTPCDAAPLSALFLSMAVHKAPMQSLEALFGDEPAVSLQKNSAESFAVPLNTINVLHERDSTEVQALSKKYASKDLLQAVTAKTCAANVVSSHFLVPSVVIRKNLGRQLVPRIEESEIISKTAVKLKGKLCAVYSTDTVSALPRFTLNEVEGESDPKLRLDTAIETVSNLRKSKLNFRFSDAFCVNTPQSRKNASIQLTQLYKTLFDECTEKQEEPTVKTFTSLISHITRRHAWGNNGYPTQRLPVLCVPFAVQTAVCEGLMDTLQSVRYSHACDDLHADPTKAGLDGIRESDDPSKDPGLLYGPLRSGQSALAIEDYVRSMQQKGFGQPGDTLRRSWQLMAGGCAVPFPSGSYYTPAVLVVVVQKPIDFVKLEKEMDALAMAAPEGPIMHIICVKEEEKK